MKSLGRWSKIFAEEKSKADSIFHYMKTSRLFSLLGPFRGSKESIGACAVHVVRQISIP